MTIIAIGRAPASSPEAMLFARYAERLKPPLGLVALADGRGSAGEIKAREGAAILAALPAGAVLVVLDQGGAAETTEAFAGRLGRWREAGRDIAFAIGGAEGHDRPVLDRAAHVMSLGPATWPHLLARAMLAEQIFRADSLLRGHPYHRSGRP
nr:23S rRNA (pseudouridine(1915)-N(3))-methyltransferase RlmH [Elioraea sp.]